MTSRSQTTHHHPPSLSPRPIFERGRAAQCHARQRRASSRRGEARGARGEVRARIPAGDGEAVVLLGRDFLLDLELVEAIQAIPGISNVALDRVASQLRAVG